MYVASNKLDVMTADIQNTYLQAPSSEKQHIIWARIWFRKRREMSTNQTRTIR